MIEPSLGHIRLPTMVSSSQVALKCADLGHLTSSSEVHKRWVSQLEEEMFRQGDQERALGQPISPLMDRSKGGVTKSQTGFFNIVASPMYKAFAETFPNAADMHDNLMVNFSMWSDLEAKAAVEAAAKAAAAGKTNF